MKKFYQYAILLNWTLSFLGLTFQPFIWSLIGAGWFAISTIVIIKADRKKLLTVVKETY